MTLIVWIGKSIITLVLMYLNSYLHCLLPETPPPLRIMEIIGRYRYGLIFSIHFGFRPTTHLQFLIKFMYTIIRLIFRWRMQSWPWHTKNQKFRCRSESRFKLLSKPSILIIVIWVVTTYSNPIAPSTSGMYNRPPQNGILGDYYGIYEINFFLIF